MKHVRLSDPEYHKHEERPVVKTGHNGLYRNVWIEINRIITVREQNLTSFLPIQERGKNQIVKNVTKRSKLDGN